MYNTEKWDRWFLGMAEYVSTASKDPSTKVGAVIVDENRRVISVGYNGFPQKIKDTDVRLNNRELKLKLVVHSEINALLFANSKVKDCTLYTFPFMPCSKCCSIFIQSGIKRIVSLFSENKRWVEDFGLTTQLCDEAQIELKIYDIYR